MIYAIVPLETNDVQNDALRKKIDSLNRTNGPSSLTMDSIRVYTEAAPDLYFVVYDGTTRDLAEKIGYCDPTPEVGAGVVIQVSHYYGYASGNMWDWLGMQHGR